MKNKRVIWITRTAVYTALLLVMQAATAPLGMTLVTGSLVNGLLILAVMTSGFWSGFTVAMVSPFFAKLFGIGPALWPLIPFIALGNAVLVTLWFLIGARGKNKLAARVAAAAVAAAAKFTVLYLTVVQLAVPLILRLPAGPAAVISATFSLPQLFTALIGGAIAVLILPVAEKAAAARG